MKPRDLLIGFALVVLMVPWLDASQVTIYEDGISLIRESRRLELKPGMDTVYIENLPLGMDRNSLKVEIPRKKIRIAERIMEFDLISADRSLEKSIGKQVEVICDDGRTQVGELVCFDANNLVIRVKPGMITVLARDHISEIRLPDLMEDMLTKPRLKLVVESSVGGTTDVSLTYFTSGLTWQAYYMGELQQDEKSMSIEGWVVITNTSGVDYRDCEINLISGWLHRAPRAYPVRNAKIFEAAAAPIGIEESALFEYHTYKIDRKADLPNQTTTQVDLFEPTRVACSKEFVFDDERSKRVQVSIGFENAKDGGLGIPLPAGRLSLFKRGRDGRLEFIGEDNIEHIAKGEKVRVNVGDAFDLEAKRERIDYAKISDRLIEETIEIKLSNYKQDKVTIKVIERIYGEWEIKQSSLPYKKVKSDQIDFDADVPAGDEVVITYTVRRKV